MAYVSPPPRPPGRPAPRGGAPCTHGLYSNAYTADAYVTAASWSFVGYALDIAAAVLAIRFVRRLTSMQHAKATGVLPAAR